MATVDDILSKVDSAISSDVLDTPVANAAAVGIDMSTNADMVKGMADTDIQSISDLYAALDSKLDTASQAFDQVSQTITTLLDGLSPQLATPIDTLKLTPATSAATYIPGNEDLAVSLGAIPTAAEAGVVSVAETVATNLAAVEAPADLPTAAEAGVISVAETVAANVAAVDAPLEVPTLADHGIDADFVAGTDMTTFVASVTSAVEGLLGETIDAPALSTLNPVSAPDISGMMPDTTAVDNAYREVLSDLAAIGAPPDLSEFKISQFEYGFTALWSALQQRLSQLIQGGTGLDPAAEEALWNRHREREAKAVDQSVRRATNAMAAKGYTMPPGKLTPVLAEILNKSTDVALDASRDIAYKQADLMHTTLTMAVDKGIQLETANADIFLRAKGMEIEHKRFMAGLAVEAYKLRLVAVQAKTDVINGIAGLLDVQLKAVNARIEFYRSQLESEKLKADFDQAKVQQYAQAVQLLSHRAQAVATLAQALRLIVDTDQIKTDVYRTKIQGFGARLSASESDMQRYAAGLKAAALPIDVQQYLTQAFQAAIQGGAADRQRYEAALRAAGLPIEVQQYLTDAYRTTVQGISAGNEAKLKAVDEKISRFQSIVQLMANEVKVGELEVDRFARTQGAYNDIYRTQVEQQTLKLDAAVKNYVATIQGVSAKKDIIIGKIDLAKWKLNSYSELLQKSGSLRNAAYVEQIRALGQQLGQAYAALNAIGLDFRKI